MTITQKTLAALLVSSTALTGTAVAEVSIEGNVGATTDYIWRGNTQSSGDASLSGGIDVDFGNGFAIGTWVGSLGASDDMTDDDLQDSANYELDVYGSYSTELSGVGVEIGYISYMYPGVADSGSDFADYYVAFSYGPASFSYYALESAEDAAFEATDETYMSLDLEFPLVQDWSLGLHYGVQDWTNPADAAADAADSDEDTSFTLSKGDMSFTVSGDEGDDTRAIVSWGTSF